MDLSRRQEELCGILTWPDWITGRSLRQLYENTYEKSMSYGSLYLEMGKLVELDFAEAKTYRDEDGLVRSFRKNATGNRTSLKDSNDQTSLDDLLPDSA